MLIDGKQPSGSVKVVDVVIVVNFEFIGAIVVVVCGINTAAVCMTVALSVTGMLLFFICELILFAVRDVEHNRSDPRFLPNFGKKLFSICNWALMSLPVAQVQAFKKLFLKLSLRKA